MFLSKFVDWLKLWDRYRTVFIFLLLDALQAEAQFLYFFYSQLWDAKRVFLLNTLGTIKSSSKYGFQQYPTYNIMLYYFIVVGALIARLVINWLVFDGISSGNRTHVRAATVAMVCTTLYIVIGGILFWVEQYNYFNLEWYHVTLAIVGFLLYGLLTAGTVFVLWHDEPEGYSKPVAAAHILICGIFMGFVVSLWFLAATWNKPLDSKFHPMTDRFPV